jgi:hypothetical protein
MKRILIATVMLTTMMPLAASAQMMGDQSYAIQNNCGEAITQYCPQVDQQSFDALWQCLSPYFDKIDPMCKATLQEIQED